MNCVWPFRRRFGGLNVTDSSNLGSDALLCSTKQKSRFEAAEDPKGREFLLEVASNLVLTDRTVQITAKNPFGKLRRVKQVPHVWALRKAVRTWVT